MSMKEQSEGMILVDAVKLAQGLKTTFNGVAMVCESLGAKEVSDKIAGPDEKPDTDKPADEKPTAELVKDDEDAETTEPAKSHVEDSRQKAPTVTVDDITKVIVAKIKQKRSNSDLIQKLITAYGVKKVSELPESKYEAFLTDLSQI